jgi:DNA-binding NarL/FixJ family response regulator
MGSELPHRVLVVDDHQILRQALRVLLEQEAELAIVGDTETGEAAIAASQLQPGVILLNVAARQLAECLSLVADLRQRTPDARIVILYPTHADPPTLLALVRAGVTGCISAESADLDDLINAIRRVSDGRFYFSESAIGDIVETIARGDWAQRRERVDDLTVLSEREREVLDLVARGYSNRHIADNLVISESTVRSHLHNILEKLHVENRVQAAAFVIRSSGKPRRPLGPALPPHRLAMRGDFPRRVTPERSAQNSPKPPWAAKSMA